MERKLIIGKKNRHQVTIEIEIKTIKDYKDKLDVNLNPITEPFTILSICASSKYFGGQSIDEVKSMDECYLEKDQLNKLIEIWERWHLNDMKSACIHQRNNWNLYEEIELIKIDLFNLYKVKYDKSINKILYFLDDHNYNSIRQQAIKQTTNERLKLDNVWLHKQWESKVNEFDKTHHQFVELVKRIKIDQIFNGIIYQPKDNWEKSWFDNKIIQFKTEKEKVNWTYPSEHPKGILSKACPDCGYQYGTKQLVELIPDDVIHFLEYELNINIPTPLNEIDRWMKDHNICIKSINQVNSNPDMDNFDMDHWIYTFECEGKTVSFNYSTGYGLRLGIGEYLNLYQKKLKLNQYLKESKIDSNIIKLMPIPSSYPSDEDKNGVPKPPLPRNVFDNIMEEVNSFNDFDDYVHMANEYGYPLDSNKDRLKAKKIYLALEDNKLKMESLIGRNLIEDYLNHLLS